MNILKEHKTINSVLDKYRAQLDFIPDDKFEVTPPNGGWSYAEVYSHIMNATMGASIAMERCTHATSKGVTGKPTLLGKLVLLLGSFPMKIKTPEAVAARVAPQRISKEEARNLIVKCRKRMEDMVSVVGDSASKRRMQHPNMGMLSAPQWFKFIRIHLQHHLKQLKRIENNFSR